VNILLAVDASDASKKAVAFVGRTLASCTGDHSVTLFHVVESLPDYLLVRSAETSDGNVFRQVADELNASNRVDGERLLEQTQGILTSAGVANSAVCTKLAVRDGLPEAKKVVAALAIIEEMRGDYNVVCVGRRGTSATAGSFPGSVAEKVLREAHGKTVWVVD